MKMWKRFWISALCVCAVAASFAQDGGDPEYQQRVADAAVKYKAGQEDAALAEFNALYKENAKNADVNSWLGYIYLRNRDAKKAIPFLVAAKDLNPRDVEVLNNLGNAYQMDKQTAKAIATYQDLIMRDKTRYQAYYNLGNMQLEVKDYLAAEASYGKAVELRKDWAPAHNNLGVAAESQSKYDKAAASFGKASDLDSKDETYAKNAGATYYKLSKYADAAKYLERARANGNKEKDIVVALIDSYGKLDRTAELNALYAQNADLFAGDANYYFNLGAMKKRSGDVEGAEAAFRKVVELKPDHSKALANLGVLLFAKGQYSEARVAFEKAMKLEGTPQNKKNFAAAASREGDFKAAMPIWSEILKANPHEHEIRILLADALYNTGDIKVAMGMYKQVLAAKPKSATALDGIGRCHLADANYVAAEASLRSAIAADKNYIPAYNNLAFVLEKMNKRAQAIALLEKANSMDPNNADVQANLKRMKSAG